MDFYLYGGECSNMCHVAPFNWGSKSSHIIPSSLRIHHRYAWTTYSYTSNILTVQIILHEWPINASFCTIVRVFPLLRAYRARNRRSMPPLWEGLTLWHLSSLTNGPNPVQRQMGFAGPEGKQTLLDLSGLARSERASNKWYRQVLLALIIKSRSTEVLIHIYSPC